VFANLLQNAAKYSGGPGQVRVALRVEDDAANVDVSDSGIGIDPESLTSIFELFVQGASEQRPQRGGLGIGLAMVKGIVELHGGSVIARSEGPGTGSTFTVTLPLAEAIPTMEPRFALPAANGSTLSILVVDDNRDAADSLAALLRTLGYTVQASYDGKDALSVYESMRPDAVLLDIGLPDVSGYEIAQQLRRAPGGENVLLIAITGWAQADVKSSATAAGFNHHLPKPADIDALLLLLSAHKEGRPKVQTVQQ
jgi:CheY-like chemotaxis protein